MQRKTFFSRHRRRRSWPSNKNSHQNSDSVIWAIIPNLKSRNRVRPWMQSLWAQSQEERYSKIEMHRSSVRQHLWVWISSIRLWADNPLHWVKKVGVSLVNHQNRQHHSATSSKPRRWEEFQLCRQTKLTSHPWVAFPAATVMTTLTASAKWVGWIAF